MAFVVLLMTSLRVTCRTGSNTHQLLMVVHLTLLKLPAVFHMDMYWDFFFFCFMLIILPLLYLNLMLSSLLMIPIYLLQTKIHFELNSTANEAINKLNKWFLDSV